MATLIAQCNNIEILKEYQKLLIDQDEFLGHGNERWLFRDNLYFESNKLFYKGTFVPYLANNSRQGILNHVRLYSCVDHNVLRGTPHKTLFLSHITNSSSNQNLVYEHYNPLTNQVWNVKRPIDFQGE